MKNKINKNEELQMKAILDEAVQLGHAEWDSRGRYRLTASGRSALAVDCVLEIIGQRHDSAFTFGGLVHATDLDPKEIESALATLINDGVTKIGVVAVDGEGGQSLRTHIFYVCEHKERLHVCCAPDETPYHCRYQEYVKNLMGKIPANAIGGE